MQTTIENKINFGEMIQEKRKSEGLTLREIQQRTNITSAYIHRLEKGDRENPGFTTVCDLAVGLGLNIDQVLNSFGYSDLNQNKESSALQPTYVAEDESLNNLQKNELSHIIQMIVSMAKKNDPSVQDQVMDQIKTSLNRMIQI